MAPVTLNVYDLTPQNDWTYWVGVGVFHTGVEVYGIEYAYGGHDYDVSGVFATNPREAPGAVHFRESIPMGETDKTPAQVQQLIAQMGYQYRGNSYHLLQKNCNHFASDLCKELTGLEPPSWINRLAGIAVMLHCLLPTTWVPPLDTPSIAPAVDASVATAPSSTNATSASGKRRTASRAANSRVPGSAAIANGNSSSSSSEPQLKSRTIARSNSRTRLLDSAAADDNQI